MIASFEALENSLRSWVQIATGLPNDRVIWADQNARQPEGSFVTLRLIELDGIGQAFDRHVESYDPAAAAGSEIELRSIGERRVTVSVQAFSVASVGNTSAFALVNALKLAGGSPTARAALDAAGATLIDISAVRNLGALDATDFEGRASVDASFYFAASHSTFVTFIETVETNGTVT